MIVKYIRLPTIEMLAGCATPYLAMLRWIAYIKFLNLEIRHISEKTNGKADMLSRARFESESNIVSEDEEITLEYFKTTQASMEEREVQVLNDFNESKYIREWMHVAKFLSTMTTNVSWSKEEVKRI